ncbi:vacuolar sorting protein (macronuclear) [Tetrahymena thermophila SB210]|uniref:Vacuolar sorting protein n=1 Tax=Tetrahymena thermophila (strain SB210) TaxID=312017 RepID=Q23PQ9_TETTS|nr:vacuolar sorting protein [Tetrahymena thermophila SB210]EAR98626.3 vacuolar sorting protein [Tetrahymena thermophila SB210]|eukprot:XP_001018871.3 vacuolar sorting protein [Tetrahymena thermophila SB210]
MSFKEVAVQGYQRNRNNAGIANSENSKSNKQQYYNSGVSTSIQEESEIQESLQWGDPKQREEEIVGFQEKQVDYSSPIEVKNLYISLPQQKIKHLAISQKSAVAITENNMVIRWKFENGYDTYESMSLPEKVSGLSLGGKLANVGGKIGGKIIPFKRFKKYQNDKEVERQKRRIIDRVYMDRVGQHCIITNNTGYTYYLNHNSSQVKPLPKLKRIILKSVMFDDRQAYKTLLDDKTFLFGSENNSIYQCKLEYNEKDGQFYETVPQLLISIHDEKPKFITDIKILHNKFGARKGEVQTIVLASTNSQIYFFCKSAKELLTFDQLFKEYDNVQSMLYTMPTPASHLSFTDLCYEYDSKLRRRCRSYIYTNGNYLQYYKFPEKEGVEEIDDNFFRTVNYFNYGKEIQTSDHKAELKVKDMPLGVGITLYHYIILHSDSVSVLSQITQQVVFHENLTKLGKIYGMVNDMENKCYWIYGESKIVRLFIKNEFEQSWRIYLELKNYEKAYQLCRKTESEFIPTISLQYGNQLFDQQKYKDAARIYLESSLGFEEVFVKFQGIDIRVQEGLAEYIQLFLLKNERVLQEFQIRVLTNWLADFYIHKVTILNQRVYGAKNKIPAPNEISKDSLILDMKESYEVLKRFMDKYQKYLIEDLIYELMSSYGQLELCLNYALQKENYQMVIGNYIHSERYSEAIQVMRNMPNCTEFAYKYSDILMKKETKQFIDLLKNSIQKFEPSRIMRSLMEIEKETPQFEEGFQFIKYCINERKLREQIVHNIYIFYLSEHKDKNLFTEYMIETEKKILNGKQQREYFDMNFAFNLAKAHNFVRATISLLAMKKLFEEAVQIAIENNMIDVAIEYAQLSEQIVIYESQKTWMKIIEHMMKTEQNGPQKIEKIFNVMEQCAYIKIEDLIPYFDNNMPLSLFKGKIEESVRSYQEDIVGLKNEINYKNEKLEELKGELSKQNGKYMRISEKSTCYICSEFLLNNDFITFPCDHHVHKKCAIQYIQSKQLYTAEEIQEIISLTERIAMLRRNVRSYDPNQVKKCIEFYTQVYRSFNQTNNSKEDQIYKYVINYESDIVKLKQFNKQLDDLICKECPLCGPIHASLAFQNYEKDNSWTIE